MDPEEGKQQNENQEEEQEKKLSKEPSVKGEDVGGNSLKLGEGENDSSSEAKHKEDIKLEEEKKEGEQEGGENEGKSERQNTEQQKETFRSISGEEENENKKDEIKNSQKFGSKINEEKTREKTFENVKLIYKYQLNQIGKMDNFERIYDKFWKLLPQTFEGEISKLSFITLITKILKVLLPLFNYTQINKYVEGLWIKYTKGKNTMSKEVFNKAIFKLTHLLSVNVNQYEYEDTLNLIYGRITCVRKYYANGEEKVYYPSIKVSLINSLTKEEYQNCTWEVFDRESGVNLELFEQYENEINENTEEKNAEGKNNEENKDKSGKNVNSEGDEEKEKIVKVRPRLKIIYDFNENKNNKENVNINQNNKDEKVIPANKSESYYENDKNIYYYSEDTFYVEQNEIDSYSEELNCHIKYELMENYKDGFELDAVKEKFTDYFYDYDYLLGDWSYGKLRLKGFCNRTNRKCNRINDIKYKDKYIKELCSYECRYFILKKID